MIKASGPIAQLVRSSRVRQGGASPTPPGYGDETPVLQRMTMAFVCVFGQRAVWTTLGY